MKDEIKISYSVCSEAGRIAGGNEDNFYVNGRILKTGVPCCRLTENTESGDALFAVFDGLGGEEHGELASAMAAENLGRYHGTFGSFYDQYLNETNQMITEKLQKGKANTGTTVAAVAIRGREAVVVNLGDSRVYLIQGNTIRQLTAARSGAILPAISGCSRTDFWNRGSFAPFSIRGPCSSSALTECAGR